MKKKFLVALPLFGIALGLAACGQTTVGTSEGPNTTLTPEPTQSKPTVSYSDKTYYASPNGSGNANGTKGSPFDIRTGFVKLQAGDTLILLDGTYKLDNRILVPSTQNGVSGHVITVKAENAMKVTIDFSEQRIDTTSRGIQINGDYWYLYGLDVMGAGDNGVYISGSFNTVENCAFHENQDTGLQIGRAESDQVSIKDWPHNNLIKNCTSYNNYDYQSYGENADGFAAKLTTGEGNIFDGCIAYRNSDDGWDLYAKSDSGQVGSTIIKNCVSFENGLLLDHTATPDDSDLDKYGATTITSTAKMLAKQTNKSYATRDGDGIGFKLGGLVMEGNVIVENCMAFNNRLHGFSDNSNPGVLSLRNCTSFNNSVTFDYELGEILPNGNTSNNFDLARDEKSYNNYYGLLSYMTNQTDTALTYTNKDAYRGSIGYSIFNVGKNKYSAFTTYQDGSSYVASKAGRAYNKMSDDIFESVDFEYNPNGNRELHTLLRNADYSVNMKKMLNVKDPELLTFCEGKQIGCKLNETSWDSYDHYQLTDQEGKLDETDTVLEGAKDVLEIMCNPNAVYQDVNLLTKINGCDVTWSSSNELVLQCGRPKEDNPNEFITNSSVSGVTFIEGVVHRDREKDVVVTLTATISYGGKSVQKKFDLCVKRNVQAIGDIVGFEDRYILTQFGEYTIPEVVVLNESSYSGEALIKDIDYTVTNRILYANSSKDFAEGNYYEISKVYTSLPGVYKIVYEIKSLISDEYFETSFNAYVVSEEADIDVANDENGKPIIDFNVSRDGVKVSAKFTNILGSMYIYTSKNETETVDTIVKNGKLYEITDETLSAVYNVDNNEGYFAHVCINNKKNTIENPKVYSKEITIQTISTKDEFFNLVSSEASPTVIYLLTQDLDFTGYNWVSNNTESFGGLFNGNGHKISNISIASLEKKGTAVFYKLKNGTIENLVFENIVLQGSAQASLAGIVGQMNGGYIHNVALKNVSACASTGASALVGQVTGGVNYITQVSLVNDSNTSIEVDNKYCGGLVANFQKDSTESFVELYMSDCYVNATIGDGKDAGGYIGGLVGRNKNEFASYKLSIKKCIFEGQVKTNKDYSGGILAGCDNGAGSVSISDCASNCTILLKGVLIDGISAMAAKNDSPIIGRVTKGQGSYFVSSNYARFNDSQFSNDYEEFEALFKNKDFFNNILALDLENVWIFDENTLTISLRIPQPLN